MLSNYHIEEGKKGKVENSSKSFESSFISQPPIGSSLLQMSCFVRSFFIPREKSLREGL